MNLYQLHHRPDDLAHSKVAGEQIPELIWNKYKNTPNEQQAALAKSPAYAYAKNILKGTFKAGEAAIAKDPEWAFIHKHISS